MSKITPKIISPDDISIQIQKWWDHNKNTIVFTQGTPSNISEYVRQKLVKYLDLQVAGNFINHYKIVKESNHIDYCIMRNPGGAISKYVLTLSDTASSDINEDAWDRAMKGI